MPKASKYELLVYVHRSIDGEYDYLITGSRPLPQMEIGMAFKSYLLEKKFPPQEGCEYRIRDIQLVHYSQEGGPNVWQTKIRLASFRRIKGFSMKDGDRIPSEYFQEVEDGIAKEAKEVEVSRKRWDTITKLLENPEL